MWNIYSIGDSYYLYQILNAVAAICGTDNFTQMCGLSLFIGIFLICFKVLLQKQGLDIQIAAICYVFWFACFYPSTSVNIHDVYTGEDRQVDNVPIGPAIIGSTLSTLGFKVTEMMEMAFQMPEATSTITGAGGGEGGRYGNALYFLTAAMRLATQDSTAYGTYSIDEIAENGGQPANRGNVVLGDFRRTVSDYVCYCTYRAVAVGPRNGGKTIDQIKTLPANEALKFDTNTYMTVVYTNGNAVDMTCGDAWDVIMQRYNNFANAPATTQLASKYNKLLQDLGLIKNRDENSIQQSATAVDLSNDVGKLLRSLRIDAADSQRYMLAVMTRNILDEGMARGYENHFQRSAATMINQAIMQRNVQWAAEQTMFFDTMRPMLSFIEGFAYAIVPFSGFILLLGEFGIRLFLKHCLLLVWIQLWIPVVAICNLFIQVGATRELQEFAAPGATVSSFYAIEQMWQVASTWIATGGMFAAATPVLTFIIVSGSAYALTSMTNRMAGSDHINEKIVAPDVVEPGASLAMQSLYQGDSMKAVLSGARELSPSINVGSIAQTAASTARQQANTTAHSFMNSYSDTVGINGNKLSSSTQDSLFSEAYSTSQSHDISAAISDVKSQSAAKGITLSDQHARMLAVGLGMNFLAKAQRDISVGENTTLGDVFNDLTKHDFQFSEAGRSQISDVVSSTVSNTKAFQESSGISAQSARSLQNQASDVVASSKIASQLEQVSRSIGITNSVKLVDVVGTMSDSERNDFNMNYDKFRSSLSSEEQAVLDAAEKTFISQNGDKFTSPEAAKLNALLSYQSVTGKDESLQAKMIALDALSNVPMMAGVGEQLSNIYGGSGVQDAVSQGAGGLGHGQGAPTSSVKPTSSLAKTGSPVTSSSAKPETTPKPAIPTVEPKGVVTVGSTPNYQNLDLRNMSADDVRKTTANLLQETSNNTTFDLQAVNAQNNATVTAVGNENNAEIRAANPLPQEAIDNLNEIRALRGDANEMPDKIMAQIESSALSLVGFVGADPVDNTVGRNEGTKTVLANMNITDNMGIDHLDFGQNLKNFYNSSAQLVKENTEDSKEYVTTSALSPTPTVFSSIFNGNSDALKKINKEQTENKLSREAVFEGAKEALMQSEDFDNITKRMGINNDEEKAQYAESILRMTENAASGSYKEQATLLYVTHNMGDAMR